MHGAATESPPARPIPVVSAEELHRTLLKAHALGNQSRRRFIDALRAMAEAKLYLTFGFSSIAGYSERFFSLSRSQTYELLRVGDVLSHLPLLDAAFGEGTLTWTLVREISRVATAETEEEWLKFHGKHTVAELHAEIRDAAQEKRRRPRHDSYGLPALTVDVSFVL